MNNLNFESPNLATSSFTLAKTGDVLVAPTAEEIVRCVRSEGRGVRGEGGERGEGRGARGEDGAFAEGWCGVGTHCDAEYLMNLLLEATVSGGGTEAPPLLQ